MMASLTIGELAEAAGTTVETIRYYERRRLLRIPPRTTAGYRQYSEEDRWRLAFINRAKQLGFTLREIRELIGTEGPHTPQAVLTAARRKLDEVDEKARELAAFRANLDRLVRACQHGNDAECLGLGLATTS